MRGNGEGDGSDARAGGVVGRKDTFLALFSNHQKKKKAGSKV